MEPIQKPSEEPKLPSLIPGNKKWRSLKEVPKMLQKAYSVCSQALHTCVSFFKELIPRIGKKKPPEGTQELPTISLSYEQIGTETQKMSSLRAAHLRFHRFDLDPTQHPETLTILDGSNSRAAFNHFVENDWTPARELLLATVEKESVLGKSILSINTTIENSRTLYNPPEHIESWNEFVAHITTTLQQIKEGETYIFPGDTTSHATLFEVKKQGGKYYLKFYDTSAGAEVYKERYNRCVVPLYEIPEASIGNIVKRLIDLHDLPWYKLDWPFRPLFKHVEAIVRKHGGKRLVSDESHRMQDRGNCCWKAISTWFRAQSQNQKFTVTQEMVNKAGEVAPYAQESLKKCIGQKITLNQFCKIIGYEHVRSELRQVVTACIPYYHTHKDFLPYFGRESTRQKRAVEYLSSLTQRIEKESAIARYEHKKSVRAHRTRIDKIIDTLWRFCPIKN